MASIEKLVKAVEALKVFPSPTVTVAEDASLIK